MPNKNRAFWLSYDLGFNGDFPSLYAWLDELKAKECGNSIAYFRKEYSDNFLEEISAEIKAKIKFKSTDRVYLIWQDDADNKGKGRFIIGNRKGAPWDGFSASTTSQTTDS